MAMTSLDRRDRRRARHVVNQAGCQFASWDLTPLIADALKREREETGTAIAFHECPCAMCAGRRKHFRALEAKGGKR